MMSDRYDPIETADYELGRLIDVIGNMTWDECLSFAQATRIYHAMKPMLTAMQTDAFQIVLDLMEMEEVA